MPVLDPLPPPGVGVDDPKRSESDVTAPGAPPLVALASPVDEEGSFPNLELASLRTGKYTLGSSPANTGSLRTSVVVIVIPKSLGWLRLVLEAAPRLGEEIGAGDPERESALAAELVELRAITCARRIDWDQCAC